MFSIDLLQVKQADELAQGSAAAAALASDLGRFSKAVALTSFKAFGTAAEALAEASAVSEGGMTDTLKAFLQMNLPKVRDWGLRSVEVLKYMVGRGGVAHNSWQPPVAAQY